MRKIIIAGNWKMNKTIPEAMELVNNLKRELSDINNVDIVVIPPYTALSEISDMLTNSNVELGAQDVYWEEKGAFTGEVSAVMLRDVGVKYAVIGHSERRTYFNETNETVNKKVKAALKAGLPHTVSATTVNKICGSSLKTVIMGANAVVAGEAEIIVAGVAAFSGGDPEAAARGLIEACG